MGRQEELKAKNTPIDGAHYTFKLDEVDLVYAPDGWDDDEFTLQRDMIRFGVFRKFSSLELKFVKDGRDYLSAAYELGGVNTQTQFTVTETNAVNVTRTRFIGYIDYSTYKITELSVDVQVIDGSFTDQVLSRMATDVNLLSNKSIDGDNITVLNLTNIILPEIIINQVGVWDAANTSEIISDNHALQVNIVSSEFSEALSTEGLYGGFFFNNAVAVYLGASLTIKIRASADASDIGDHFFLDFHLDRWNGGILTEPDIYSKNYESTGHFPFNIIIDEVIGINISVGDSFILRCEFTNDIGFGNIQYSVIDYRLQKLVETIPEKQIKAILYHEAYEKLIQIYTGFAGRFKSNAIGRTDIGYAADGYIGAITAGRYIRDLWGLNGTIPVSGANLLKSHNSIYNIGLGIETIGGVEKVVIEPMAYFFSDAIVLDISNRIAPETITNEYYPELAYNRIICGYNSFDYETLGGIYEYNTSSKFTTCIKPVDKELNIVSPYRADMSGVLKLITETIENKDIQGENDIFILDTIRNGAEYVIRTNEGFEQSDDLGNKDVLINLAITPKRNLLRWGSFLRGFLEKYIDSLVIWQTSDKNTMLSSTETGQSTITENSDILVSDLSGPLWIPEIVQFEVPALDTDILVIEANKYGLIKYTATDYGWILTYKAKNENGKCEFTLLRCNTDYVIPGGTPPVYPSSLNVNVIITDLPSDNFTFTLLIISGGVLFLSQLISQDNPFELTHLPYGTYDIYLYVTDTGYELTTVVPVTITISADNLHEVVDIVVYKIPTTGTVTVTKLITGVTEDETYFDITITGTDGEMVEQFDQVRLNEPLTFYDMPFGTYEITETATDGYTLSSITPSTVVLSEGNTSEGVEIVNEVASTEKKLKITYNNISNVPVDDVNSISDWNTYYGSDFASVEVIGNSVILHDGNPTALFFDGNGGDANMTNVEYAYTILPLTSLQFVDTQNMIDIPNVDGLVNIQILIFQNIVNGITIPNLSEFTELIDVSFYGSVLLGTTGVDEILSYFSVNYPSLLGVTLQYCGVPTPSVLLSAQTANPQCTFTTD